MAANAVVSRASAGLLVFRTSPNGDVEVLLVHPGGPWWAHRDDGSWSLPKGEVEPGEEPLEVAEREFGEEIGRDAPDGPRHPLGEVRQRGGKRVAAWAVEGDVDLRNACSNTFDLEWPPHSGVVRSFPEVDRTEWTPLAAARRKLLAGQQPLLDRLVTLLDTTSDGGRTDGG